MRWKATACWPGRRTLSAGRGGSARGRPRDLPREHWRRGRPPGCHADGSGPGPAGRRSRPRERSIWHRAGTCTGTPSGCRAWSFRPAGLPPDRWPGCRELGYSRRWTSRSSARDGWGLRSRSGCAMPAMPWSGCLAERERPSGPPGTSWGPGRRGRGRRSGRRHRRPRGAGRPDRTDGRGAGRARRRAPRPVGRPPVRGPSLDALGRTLGGGRGPVAAPPADLPRRRGGHRAAPRQRDRGDRRTRPATRSASGWHATPAAAVPAGRRGQAAVPCGRRVRVELPRRGHGGGRGVAPAGRGSPNPSRCSLRCQRATSTTSPRSVRPRRSPAPRSGAMPGPSTATSGPLRTRAARPSPRTWPWRTSPWRLGDGRDGVHRGSRGRGEGARPVEVIRRRRCVPDCLRRSSFGAEPSGWSRRWEPSTRATSLDRRARAERDVVVVSIFVNPLQFGPAEDLDGVPPTTWTGPGDGEASRRRRGVRSDRRRDVPGRRARGDRRPGPARRPAGGRDPARPLPGRADRGGQAVPRWPGRARRTSGRRTRSSSR